MREPQDDDWTEQDFEEELESLEFDRVQAQHKLEAAENKLCDLDERIRQLEDELTRLRAGKVKR